MRTAPPRFGIVGWKDTGKTTMTARLVQELVRRGYRVATVKRAHSAFDIDRAGTDSHTHRTAGAAEVAIISRNRWALMHENESGENEATLDEIVERLSPCDVVLVEGFKAECHPKVEMRHAANPAAPMLADDDPAIVALVFDEVPHEATRFGRPVFQRDQVGAIAQLVEEACELAGHARRTATR